MAGKDFCCGKAIIRAGTDMLCTRLLENGKEAYAGLKNEQRVILYVFAFFDGKNMCPKCKSDFSGMIEWFTKYNMFDDPARAVRIVLEDDPSHNLMYPDLGITKLPLFLYCDGTGRIMDIRFDFPSTRWLEEHILPYYQSDVSIF